MASINHVFIVLVLLVPLTGCLSYAKPHHLNLVKRQLFFGHASGSVTARGSTNSQGSGILSGIINSAKSKIKATADAVHDTRVKFQNAVKDTVDILTQPVSVNIETNIKPGVGGTITYHRTSEQGQVNADFSYQSIFNKGQQSQNNNQNGHMNQLNTDGIINPAYQNIEEADTESTFNKGHQNQNSNQNINADQQGADGNVNSPYHYIGGADNGPANVDLNHSDDPDKNIIVGYLNNNFPVIHLNENEIR